jgi:hypothetical protein
MNVNQPSAAARKYVGVEVWVRDMATSGRTFGKIQLPLRVVPVDSKALGDILRV